MSESETFCWKLNKLKAKECRNPKMLDDQMKKMEKRREDPSWEKVADWEIYSNCDDQPIPKEME